MGQWSKLSAKEKAQIIKFAIDNGVSDINSIRDTYNVYAKDSLANVDYNMAAAKASGFGSNGNGHYPDTFKKPNHPTFSDESVYNSEATPGGRWRGNTYEPSDYVINRQGGWNQFLRGFYNQEQGTGAAPVFSGGIMLPEVIVTPQYKEGGKIYIKPSKRGTFTAAATKHGKSVQEFARQVLANKENYSPAMVRKANFARNASHWHKDGGDEKGNYSFIDFIRDFKTLKSSSRTFDVDSIPQPFFDYIEDKTVKYSKSPILKKYVENIMHQSSRGQREPQDLIRALYSPKSKYGEYYTGGGHRDATWDYEEDLGWGNKDRDFVKLYIYGKPSSDIKELTGNDARGFSYTKFIDKNYPGQTIKTYEGIFPIKGNVQVSPEIYNLTEFLAKNYSNSGHYIDDASTSPDSDNVGTYRTHYQLYNGKPELVQTDLWDFGGDYASQWGKDSYNANTDRFKAMQGRLVSRVGTPFILKSINPIVVGDNVNSDFERRVSQQADALGVMNTKDYDTYNTLISLPELIVNANYGNYMNEWGERIPTLQFESSSIDKHSTGGPLYPFSFSKNPYLKVPVVRYDEGGEIRNWDTTLTGKLINYVENSDSIGWNPVDRTWEHPTLPGYDKNQIGMGVDKNETPGYWDYIQYRPKTNVPFLTELDERLIRHNAIEAANKSANARYKFAQGAVNRPKGTVSSIKDAAVVSAIYNLGAGYVANGLFEDKDFMLKLFDGTDKEVVDRINQEYKKKNRNERIHKTDAFLFAK